MLNNDIKSRLQKIEQKIERIERTHSARNDSFFNRVDLSCLDNIELDDTIDESPGDEDYGDALLKSYKRIITQDGYKLA
tara:strand:+ start:203 stop:439 length:237 start_codon:yes stop_codon:yes gene_type:complete